MGTPLVARQAPAIVGEAGAYCTGEESIRVTSWNGVSAVELAIGVRFLQLGAPTVKSWLERHVPLTDRSGTTTDHALGEGWLQGVTVIATAGSPPIGGTFVRVDLIRGRGTSATVLQTLLQGPVTGQQRRAWPGSPILSSLECPGRLRSITGSNPAAGADVTETVPTGAQWIPLAGLVTLVTDATAANREVAWAFDDGATVYARVPSTPSHVASTTQRYAFGYFGDIAIGTADLTRNVSVPRVVLPAGHRIRTISTNLQAGDDFGAPQLLVEERLEAS